MVFLLFGGSVSSPAQGASGGSNLLGTFLGNVGTGLVNNLPSFLGGGSGGLIDDFFGLFRG